MNWNYRIVRVPNKFGDCEYGLYEVYYNELGHPSMRTSDPVTFVGDSSEEVYNSLRLALDDALNKEYLEDWLGDDDL